MRRLKILTQPARLSDLSFDDFSDSSLGEAFSDWHDKAHRLQVRRWRKLKQQLS